MVSALKSQKDMALCAAKEARRTLAKVERDRKVDEDMYMIMCDNVRERDLEVGLYRREREREGGREGEILCMPTCLCGLLGGRPGTCKFTYFCGYIYINVHVRAFV